MVLKRILLISPIFFLCNAMAQELGEVQEFYQKTKLSGELRGIYQYNSNYEYLDGKSGESNTGVMGGHVSLSSGKLYDFDAVLSGYGAFRGFEDKNRVDIDYLNNGRKNSDYALLGESFLRYSKENSYIQVGRFLLDTPLLNSDDVRMTPDLFEGVHASIKLLDFFTLDAGYIDAIAGWENLADNAKFENIGDAIDSSGIFGGGYLVGKSSITFAGISFEDEHLPYSFRIYDYITQKVMNQLYMESSVKLDVYEVGAQYLRSVSNERVQNFGGSDRIDSTLYGLRCGANFSTLKVSLAYNESLKKKGTLFDGGTPDFFAGANDPLYTSMDVLVADQLGGVKAYKGDISYTPMENFTMSLSYALFHKGDGNDQSESDLSFDGSLYENIDLSLKLSNLNQSDNVGATSVNNRMRVSAKIKF